MLVFNRKKYKKNIGLKDNKVQIKHNEIDIKKPQKACPATQYP
jgi:hypothetical protein